MKKLLCLMLVGVLGLVGCEKKSQPDPDKIYLFYSQQCPHCHDAIEYISQKYPDLQIEMLDIAQEKERRMLFDFAENFKLGDRIGTPFFVMYGYPMMGWSPEKATQFDRYVGRHEALLKEK